MAQVSTPIYRDLNQREVQTDIFGNDLNLLAQTKFVAMRVKSDKMQAVTTCIELHSLRYSGLPISSLNRLIGLRLIGLAGIALLSPKVARMCGDCSSGLPTAPKRTLSQ